MDSGGQKLQEAGERFVMDWHFVPFTTYECQWSPSNSVWHARF